MLDAIAAGLLEQTPPLVDADLQVRFPTLYTEARNAVLREEVGKYNRLLRTMHTALPKFRQALKGLVPMSEELARMGQRLPAA